MFALLFGLLLTDFCSVYMFDLCLVVQMTVIFFCMFRRVIKNIFGLAEMGS